VPIQIANPSLEEIDLSKYMYLRAPSPIQVDNEQDYRENIVNSAERTHKQIKDEFKDYVQETFCVLTQRIVVS